VNNLAGKAEFEKELVRLRAAHEKWRTDTADLGLVPEATLNEERRPGGQWSKTADPEIAWEGNRAKVSCGTEGASIAITWDGLTQGDKPRWLLYSGPVEFPAGKVLRAKACRLGYRDSEVVKSAR
jgi:hypothetical protein